VKELEMFADLESTARFSTNWITYIFSVHLLLTVFL